MNLKPCNRVASSSQGGFALVILCTYRLYRPIKQVDCDLLVPIGYSDGAYLRLSILPRMDGSEDPKNARRFFFAPPIVLVLLEIWYLPFYFISLWYTFTLQAQPIPLVLVMFW